MANFQKVTPGQIFRPSAAKENAVSDLLNSLGFTGGGAAPAVTVDRLTIQVKNAGSAITAGQPVPLIAPESNIGDARAVTAFDVEAGSSSAIRYGVATSNIRSGGRGTAIIHGVALAAIPSGISAGDRIGASGSGWAKDESGPAVVLAADSSGRALVYLGDAAPAPASGYNGYFKIINADGVIKVVDGATYNSSTGSSGVSLCYVNNLSFRVPVATLGAAAAMVIYLQYDVEANTVTVQSGATLPTNTETAVHYQIGRLVAAEDGYKIIQDHSSGVPQMWWIFLCRP